MTDEEIIKALRRLESKFTFAGHYGNAELLGMAADRLEDLTGYKPEGKEKT